MKSFEIQGLWWRALERKVGPFVLCFVFVLGGLAGALPIPDVPTAQPKPQAEINPFAWKPRETPVPPPRIVGASAVGQADSEEFAGPTVQPLPYGAYLLSAPSGRLLTFPVCE